ncbi:uncharacterized protein E0L32_005152 [Thyridium curvatum]|uniref:Fatty acid desaturase domain-containing protein n=1 Tax=Thyridium curvatum TaxID=1093900 RepID=A0A507B4T0_9PEZI|nr:uncharacterized protein E0L32_005152 [Thyridium curvatum]TPX14757.1 hypothetical protein E0L32_005152 [Thyridium curvatum]
MAPSAGSTTTMVSVPPREGAGPDLESLIVYDAKLTIADRMILKSLAQDIREAHLGAPQSNGHVSKDDGARHRASKERAGDEPEEATAVRKREEKVQAAIDGLNNPEHPDFETSVICTTDLRDMQLPPVIDRYLLQPYVRVAQSIVRHKTDVIMLTHLILYFTTLVPSAILLFRHFTWYHGVIHMLMQGYYVGTYTLMRHQHIHMRGVLNKRFGFFDHTFPYILDPLMGHTWNSYFYHHVKHHHVEGNGPDDLSSTLRYQRDELLHFMHYVGRFWFLIWFDLPLYFWRKRRYVTGLKAVSWEFGSYGMMYLMWTKVDARAAFCALILPFALLRIGLMVGNWGQHAFVDNEDPDSDYRSSITLIDVASNRFCYNDGYHTSHHLNPLRHWREHPNSFMRSKDTYASQHALVFHNIDYIMITVRLMMKDYMTLAKCLVPIGDQIHLTLEERAEMLKKHTRRFTEEEIAEKFKHKA